MTEESKEIARVDDKDWFLQSLIKMVNPGVIDFSITLNVGGFLVSGQLIGGKEYFEGFSDEFSSLFQGSEYAEKIKAQIVQLGDICTTSDDASPSPCYIHIKEAKFFNTNGNPIPGNKGTWWRGRISQIDGFSLGSLFTNDTY